jgi:CRP-like cAMP-binding protein
MTIENVAVLFTDVVGSTELASSLSPEGADEARRGHFSILRQALAEAGGTEVKNLGDGLMVVFGSASAALSCAVAMQQGVERDNRGREHWVGVRVERGREVSVAGAVGRECYIVVSGFVVEVEDAATIRCCGPGKSVGTGPLLDPQARTRDIVAISDAELLVFNRGEFNTMLSTVPCVRGAIASEAEEHARRDEDRAVQRERCVSASFENRPSVRRIEARLDSAGIGDSSAIRDGASTELSAGRSWAIT